MSDTGRFTVTKNGRTFVVEPIGPERTADWGSVDPVTGKLMVKKGFGKHVGAIDESDSVITKENGFKNIVTLPAGSSPMSYIEFNA